jgi:putative hydrolase of the HAD superfamily
VGTLITPSGGVGHQYVRVAERESLDLDPAVVEAGMPEAVRPIPLLDWGVEDSREDIALRERIAWRASVERLVSRAHLPPNEPVPEFDEFFERLTERMSTRDAWAVHGDVVPCIQDLLLHGYVVGLISNFDLRVYRLLDNLELSSLFDSVTIPAESRWAKPQAGIFTFARARHGLTAGESVHVGDSVGDDVEGAVHAGLRAVLLDRGGAHPDFTGAPRITSLTELRALIATLPA